MKKWQYLFGCFAVISCCVVGCGGNSDNGGGSGAGTGGGDAHDHEAHKMPETLPDALAQIKEARTELGEAYVAGDTPEADDAFHELTETLDATKGLISAANMERYDSQDAQAALDRVSELVGQLHPPHGDNAKLDSTAYDKVKADLDDAISKLEDAVNKGTKQETPAE